MYEVIVRAQELFHIPTEPTYTFFQRDGSFCDTETHFRGSSLFATVKIYMCNVCVIFSGFKQGVYL